MVFGLLVMFTALCISAVAIYYSVAGLAAIFAAAVIPIIIMGGVLEVSKLVTAVWLHRYWSQAKWWLKYYLATAVVVLMFITSMGIFGYLSKAHIEQTSASIESVEKISQLETEISRYKTIITKAEDKIETAENKGANKNDTIQDQIDREQKRIDTAYERIQPLVIEQQKIIQQETERRDKKIEPYLAQVSNIDTDLQTLSDLLNRRDSESIRRLQSIVGTRVDGTYGSRTAKQVENYRDGLIAKRESILKTIAQLEEKESPIIISANEEIKRLRDIAQREIEDSNKVINKLRSEIGSITPDNNTELIEENLLKIKKANTEIDTLTEQKYAIEAEYRKLEAEVGPIKYIAEFIYGEEADRDLLEEAVRWVIILIIFVFDPLAVLLLIASQYTFQFARRPKDYDWKEYEDKRAQHIVDLMNQQEEEPKEEEPEDKIDPEIEEEINRDADINTISEDEDKTYENEVPTVYEDIDQETLDKEVEDEVKAVAEEYKEKEVARPRLTEEQIDELDQHPQWTEAKRKWKDMNPNRTIKSFKEKYLAGEIDEFPWESYLDDDDVEAEQAKEALKQSATVEEALKLPESESVQTPIEESDRTRPDFTEVIEPSSDSNQTTADSGYIQNEEQTEDTNWRNIRDKNE
ncbi:MAG: hypothetical protein CMN00_01375 [Rickettsiales bacterium]|nr:hypothetical protein [Rickettsiales bacterium]